MANKQDSNQTGLRFAEEASLKTLAASPVWYDLEPNSYGDFGGQYRKSARNPMSANRSNKKGTIADLDAGASFNQDLTMTNALRLMQGFFFASLREQPTTKPMNAAKVTITSVDGVAHQYEAAAGLNVFRNGAIVLASNFGIAANNGIKVLDAVAAGAIDTVEVLTAEAAPPAAARVETVGHQFAAAEIAIALSGNLVRMTSSGTNLTTLGLVEGQWVYLGSDTAGKRFANNRGFARIGVGGIAAGYLQFDKVSWTPQAEAGGALTIQLFFGPVLRNEQEALIVKRTYQLERTLGIGNTGAERQAEYIEGALANTLTLNVPQGDKATIDFGFIGCDHTFRTSADGPKSTDGGATISTLEAADAINTSTDFARIRLSLVDTTDATVDPLVPFLQDLSLTINNDGAINKALGTLGGFDTSIGNFGVSGQVNAFFTDVSQVQAVRNNSDATLDAIIVERNRGLALDLPLIELGDGRLKVEINQPIDLPLETPAVESPFFHTACLTVFPYLPSLAG